MQFYTPLRYPGGKGRLARLMKQIIIENDINDATYIEPYAGGAGVALSLLMEEYVWNIVVNDIDPAVYAFWHSILNNTEWFLKKLCDTQVNMDNWYIQKQIYEKQDKRSLKQLGFATFFLNRTNRSGVLKGGVIGGKNQLGKYKVDARFNKQDLSKRIEQIAKKRSRIMLYKLDAKELINTIIPKIKGNALFYFDPPYYKKGALLYTNHYVHNDHAEIAKEIKRIKYPWIVTYDSVPQIEALFRGFPKKQFSLTYTAYLGRPKGTEFMYFHGLRLPSFFQKMNLPYFSRYKIQDLHPIPC